MFDFLRCKRNIPDKTALPPFENRPIIVSKDIDINDLFNKKDKKTLKVKNDDEEINVCEFYHEGNNYLKSDDNTIYDYETQDEIGTWDEKNKKIILKDENNLETYDYDSDMN